MKFFRVEDSFAIRNHWVLGEPMLNGEELDSRLFTECRKYSDDRVLDISIEEGAVPLDFTFGPFDMPIVKRSLAEMIENLAPAEVQRIPIRIGRLDDYEILNVLALCDGIDEERSEITRWRAEDGWPEKVGEYFGIGDLVVREKDVGQFKIFRLKNWELPLIVCETIKRNLGKLGVSGIDFKELKVS
jgi:hypothetical protein